MHPLGGSGNYTSLEFFRRARPKSNYLTKYFYEEIYTRWFFDGNLVHQLDVSSLGVNADKWPNEEMYIVLNNGQKTASPDDNTVWPNHLKVDYIRLYQRA